MLQKYYTVFEIRTLLGLPKVGDDTELDCVVVSAYRLSGRGEPRKAIRHRQKVNVYPLGNTAVEDAITAYCASHVARVLRGFKAEMEQMITAAKRKVLTEASQEHSSKQLTLKIDL
jgi:hypothetical protein